MTGKTRWFFFAAFAAWISTAAVADEPTTPNVAAPLPEPGVFQSAGGNSGWPPLPMGMLCDDSTPCLPRSWASSEYLLWWMKPVCQKASLLNSGSPTDPIPGAPGQPNTQGILTNTARYNMPGAFRVAVVDWRLER